VVLHGPAVRLVLAVRVACAPWVWASSWCNDSEETEDFVQMICLQRRGGVASGGPMTAVRQPSQTGRLVEGACDERRRGAVGAGRRRWQEQEQEQEQLARRGSSERAGRGGSDWLRRGAEAAGALWDSGVEGCSQSGR
jgi:hypothetical protein